MFASYRFLAWVPSFVFGLALFVSAARGGTVASPLDSLKKLQGTWSIQSDGIETGAIPRRVERSPTAPECNRVGADRL